MGRDSSFLTSVNVSEFPSRTTCKDKILHKKRWTSKNNLEYDRISVTQGLMIIYKLMFVKVWLIKTQIVIRLSNYQVMIVFIFFNVLSVIFLFSRNSFFIIDIVCKYISFFTHNRFGTLFWTVKSGVSFFYEQVLNEDLMRSK